MQHSNIIELSGFYFRKKKDLKEDTAAKKNCKLSSGYYDAVHLKFSYLHFTFFSFLGRQKYSSFKTPNFYEFLIPSLLQGDYTSRPSFRLLSKLFFKYLAISSINALKKCNVKYLDFLSKVISVSYKRSEENEIYIPHSLWKQALIRRYIYLILSLQKNTHACMM